MIDKNNIIEIKENDTIDFYTDKDGKIILDKMNRTDGAFTILRLEKGEKVILEIL